MDDNVVIVKFAEESKAYQALSDLNRLGDDGKVDVRSAILLERTDDGFGIPEGADTAEGFDMVAGGLIGMLVGVLAGPVGVLLGASMGTLAGGTADLARLADEDLALDGISKDIEPGSTALVAEVGEYAVEVLDEAMGALGGTVTRRPASDVYAEVVAAEDAENDADWAAFISKLDEQRAERKAKWDAFKEKASARIS
ncbi:MAG TPA: DUF1269 domain-containing protein [Gaiellaceae bacterium]|jgi:uncharacterized membrane protein|nr:DUF1269 domain-containing protein [Gaiellaceae bacterium]